MIGRTCADCSAPITRQSTTGKCRLCVLEARRHDPEAEARRIAALRVLRSDPAYLKKLSDAMKRWHRKQAETDPEYKERQRQLGHRLKATGLGNASQPKGSPGRVAVGRKLSDQRLGQWCPREYRELYQEYRRTKGYGAKRARRIVEAKIAEDRAKMTPFERQLEAVRRGAGIVEVTPIRSAGPTYSLFGNGSALCADFAP